MQNSAKAFVQDTAGYPLTVLLVLFATHKALTNAELMSWTKLSDKTLARHLDMLEVHGYIQRTACGWTLVSGLQLDLFADMPFISPIESENLRLDDSTTTAFNYISNNEKEREKVVVVVPQSRRNSDSDNSPNFRENFKMCVKLGIGEPARTRLSQQLDEYEQPITPDFIQAHVDSRKRGETMGLIILRIENNEFPAVWQEQIASLPVPEHVLNGE
jgi:hypothetical protein